MYHPQSPELKETIPHGTPSFPCAFYQTQMNVPGFMVKHHWHKEIEILYFPGGNFRMEINMEAFDISSECFYFINPGELHSVRASSAQPVQEYAVVFYPELLCSPFYDVVQAQLIQPLQNGQLLFPRCIKKEHPVFSQLRTIFLDIADAFSRCAAPSCLTAKTEPFHSTSLHVSETVSVELTEQLIIKASLLQFFALMTRYSLFSQTEKANNHKVETIKTAITYIREHYQEKIYIRDLASQIGLNEQYFCRFFKKAIGLSPVEYLNEYRIRQAIRLLKDSTLPITEISLECGYNNMGNFLREFRKYTGTTPLQYRKHSQLDEPQ